MLQVHHFTFRELIFRKMITRQLSSRILWDLYYLKDDLFYLLQCCHAQNQMKRHRSLDWIFWWWRSFDDNLFNFSQLKLHRVRQGKPLARSGILRNNIGMPHRHCLVTTQGITARRRYVAIKCVVWGYGIVVSILCIYTFHNYLLHSCKWDLKPKFIDLSLHLPFTWSFE